MPVAGPGHLPEQARGLVGQLQVGGLAGGGQFGGDELDGPPDLGALGLGQRPPAAGARADQVGLLGAQALGQDDLLPLVPQERGSEGRAGGLGRLCPAGLLHPAVRDDRRAAGQLDHAVGQPVHVEHLDPVPHRQVLDQQVELGGQGHGQVAGEGGDQDLRAALGQVGGTVQQGHGLARAGPPGHLSRAGVAGVVGDLALAGMQERAPRLERVGEDPLLLVRPGDVGDLQLADAEPVAGRVGIGLVLRQDRDQAVRVRGRSGQRGRGHGLARSRGQGRGRRSEHHAAPAAVYRHDADPVVAAVLGLGQVLGRVGVAGELGHGSVDGDLDVLVQLRVLGQEVPGDRQASHR